jgi:hypothetical protein
LQDKLLGLRNTVRIMRYLTTKELGFNLDGDNEPSSADRMFHDIKQHRTPTSASISSQSNQSTSKQHTTPTYTSRIGSNNSIIISKTKILQKIETNHHQYHQYTSNTIQQKDSYLLPPEGYDANEDEQEDIAEEVEELAKQAAEKLKAKNKNGKVNIFLYN